jgi:hypothetical protein
VKGASPSKSQKPITYFFFAGFFAAFFAGFFAIRNLLLSSVTLDAGLEGLQPPLYPLSIYECTARESREFVADEKNFRFSAAVQRRYRRNIPDAS